MQFANENPTWGYDRIQGELAKVGYHISDTTVGNILKVHGIEPAPTRNAVRQYLAHHHTERSHQGLSNRLIMPMEHPPDTGKKIETIERLGGLLRSYRRAA